MKKLITLFVVAFFALSVNAQTQKVSGPIIMSADSLIQNFDKMENVDKFTSFSVSVLVEGYSKSINNKTGKLTASQIGLIKKAKQGNRVVFEEIKGKDKDGKTIKFKDFSIKIK